MEEWKGVSQKYGGIEETDGSRDCLSIKRVASMTKWPPRTEPPRAEPKRSKSPYPHVVSAAFSRAQYELTALAGEAGSSRNIEPRARDIQDQAGAGG
jgi:hypothetical protein